MTIKEQVLKILIDNKEKSVSGEAIADQLFCSRNAVWKAIESLRNEGYKIDAVTNKGYSLVDDGGVFSSVSVEKRLKNDCRVIVLENVDSTNNYLKKLAENGERENTVVIAECQSSGKGRLGRSFFSPKSGLYMSILLRPTFSAEKSLFITAAAAVAVSDAIEEISGKKTGIKWVNDVFIGNKKVCGILTEAAVDFETGGLYYAIPGIGVNIYHPADGFPPEIRDIAGAVFDTEPDEKDLKQKLAAAIINNFFDIYNNIESSDFMQKYKQKSCILGKEIFVLRNETKTKATVLDIDEKAGLVVKYENGEVETLSSGEVSIRL